MLYISHAHFYHLAEISSLGRIDYRTFKVVFLTMDKPEFTRCYLQ